MRKWRLNLMRRSDTIESPWLFPEITSTALQQFGGAMTGKVKDDYIMGSSNSVKFILLSTLTCIYSTCTIPVSRDSRISGTLNINLTTQKKRELLYITLERI